MTRAFLALGVLLLVGCGSSSKGSSSSSSSVSVHCDYTTTGLCFTVSAPAITPTQKAALQADCAGGAPAGTFGEGACSTANTVAGVCTAHDPTQLSPAAVAGMSITGVYATAHFDATTAAANCATWAGGGTWSGGGSGNVTVSCTWAGDECVQIDGAVTGAESTQMQAGCTGGTTPGTWAAAACGTAGALTGSCYYANANTYLTPIVGVTLAGSATLRAYYYSAAWTLTEAQGDCAAAPAGVWQ
jgi:hypothetical protein